MFVVLVCTHIVWHLNWWMNEWRHSQTLIPLWHYMDYLFLYFPHTWHWLSGVLQKASDTFCVAWPSIFIIRTLLLYVFRQMVHPGQPPRFLRARPHRPVRPLVRGRWQVHVRRRRRHRRRQGRDIYHGLVAVARDLLEEGSRLWPRTQARSAAKEKGGEFELLLNPTVYEIV